MKLTFVVKRKCWIFHNVLGKDIGTNKPISNFDNLSYNLPFGISCSKVISSKGEGSAKTKFGRYNRDLDMPLA